MEPDGELLLLWEDGIEIRGDGDPGFVSLTGIARDPRGVVAALDGLLVSDADRDALLCVHGAGEVVTRILAAPDFAELSSDDRFARLLNGLTAKPPQPAPAPAVWTNLGGRPVVRIDRDPKRTQLTIDDTVEPDFATYLIQSLPQLYAAFSESKSRNETD